MPKKRNTCRLCRKSYGKRTHKYKQTMCSIVCYRTYKVEQALRRTKFEFTLEIDGFDRVLNSWEIAFPNISSIKFKPTYV